MAGVRQVKAGWYNAFRPWTLHGAIVPVLLGGAMAYGAGSEEWILFILALAGGVLLQSAANLLNTYGDYRAGLDTVENHSRAPELVSGTLRPGDVKAAGFACLAVTALIGLYMVWAAGWGIAVFGIAGIAGAGLYTVGVSYKYMGLGQASVFVMMGLLMPMGTYYLMTGALSWDVLLASLPNALMITAVLGGNELRDFDSDSAAGVRTQSYRLGYGRAMSLHLGMLTAPYFLLMVLIAFGVLPVHCLIAMLSLWQWHLSYDNARGARGDGRRSFMLVPLAFKQNWVFGVLLVIGYLAGALTA